MIKLTDLEVGTILDGLIMLKEHYGSMDEKKLKETLCGDIQNYLNTIEKLYSTFNILAYDSGSVYIDRVDVLISSYYIKI